MKSQIFQMGDPRLREPPKTQFNLLSPIMLIQSLISIILIGNLCQALLSQDYTRNILAVRKYRLGCTSDRYRNPAYDDYQLEEWWKAISKSFMTIGSKGVQQTHINSLANLLDSHLRVRVKVASDAQDVLAIARHMEESEPVAGKGELLECRKKEFMFGRKQE